MSVFYSASFHPSPCEDTLPAYHLWSDDPYLSSHLLTAISTEAANRGLSVYSVRDPFLPSRLCELRVSGLGRFTADASDLTAGARLIDCTSLCQSTVGDADQLGELSIKKQELLHRIQTVGECLHSQLALCQELSLPIVQKDALAHRAAGIAHKCKPSDHTPSAYSVCSYHHTEAIFALPFDEQTKIVRVYGAYCLPALFWEILEELLAEKKANRVILKNSLTRESIGIWLPDAKLCYLTHAPAESVTAELSLNRYLAPHTQTCRHNLRILLSSCQLWKEQLLKILYEYQSISSREEALYAPLYENNRLQNFRKRLLIDLFC